VTAQTILHPRRQAAFIFVFITVVLDMLAIGMTIPVFPQLLLGFVESNHARAAEINGLFATVWALMQFLFSPVQGALSDRFGRRPVILASNFGLSFDYVLMALAPSLAWLFVGRLLSGIAAASVSTANAYIADVTPPDQRARAFGMMGMAFGIGFILGPAVGGILGSIDVRLPFWVAAGLSLANGLYGLIVLPESLPPDKRARFEWKKANPLGSLKLLRSHLELFGLAAVSLLNSLAHAVLPTVTVLYLIYRYGWDEWMIGIAMAVIGACSMIVQGGVIGPTVAKFGERKTLFIGLMFGIAGFTMFGLAPTGIWFLASIPVMALWGLAGAAALALMSRHVSASEQGQLQGANASLMGIASMVGPAIFTLSYSAAIKGDYGFDLPGTPFLLAAGFLVVGLVVSWRVTRAG
jgi:DHA1 family tetracycline resistance protein-like MFS transporter